MGFLRKRFTVEQVAYIFVRSVHDDYDEAYSTIMNELRKIPFSDELLHFLSKDCKKLMIIAKVSLEILLVPKMFEENIRTDLMRHIIYQSADLLKSKVDYISSSIDEYTNAFKEGMIRTAGMPSVYGNPLEQFALVLYEHMNIAKREHADPFIISLLSKALAAKHGEYFKNILKDIKICR